MFVVVILALPRGIVVCVQRQQTANEIRASNQLGAGNEAEKEESGTVKASHPDECSSFASSYGRHLPSVRVTFDKLVDVIQ